MQLFDLIYGKAGNIGCRNRIKELRNATMCVWVYKYLKRLMLQK